MFITDDMKYIGVNDSSIDLFEGMYRVPEGISYNSYVLLDEQIAVIDTVDTAFAEEWRGKLKEALQGREPDYLIVQHMEPDHSANIVTMLEEYPGTKIVASAKAFEMMQNFFGNSFEEQRVVVADGDRLCLGRHTLTFLEAMMVHWPEVIMTYDSRDEVLFSADAFGKFGITDCDVPSGWVEEARRYYFGIVGKYGAAVQKVLHKVRNLELQMICPLHGPVLSGDVSYYLEKYDTWSQYEPEEEGVLIAYTSVYGNTKKAVKYLVQKLKEEGCTNIAVRDLARCELSEAVAQAFCYRRLVLATTTYNAGVFPFMREFIDWLTERHFQKRKVALVENGSWTATAAKQMREQLGKCKNIHYVDCVVTIMSALTAENRKQLEELAKCLMGGESDEICV